MAAHSETMTQSQAPTLTRRGSSVNSQQKKPWERRGSSFRSGRSQQRLPAEEVEPIARQHTRQSTRSSRRSPKWWKIRLFKGMIDDVERRAPYYWSDWRDAWDYRVIPATVVSMLLSFVAEHANVDSICALRVKFYFAKLTVAGILQSMKIPSSSNPQLLPVSFHFQQHCIRLLQRDYLIVRLR